MPGHAAALREMAAITAVIGQLPGERPAVFWVEVARLVCERHGIKSLRGHDETDTPTDLTPRQTQMLALMADGMGYKQIAHSLGLAEATVKSTLGRAYARLGAVHGAHAVALALRAGLID